MANDHKRSTDRVQLNLVTVKRSRFSQMRMDDPETWPRVLRFFFYPRPLGREQFFGLRVVLLVAMIFFTKQMFDESWVSPIGKYLHGLATAFHELGHQVFRIFGNEVLVSLGGSLFQVMMPMVCLFALWIKTRDLMGASVALWWTSENFVDVAPYIDDSVRMNLMLITGTTGAESPYGVHDWNFILNEWGYLWQCEKIADVVFAIGYTGMVLSCLWAAWSLFYFYKYQRAR